MPIAEGQRLGPYEIVARVGAGGMGEVWRARDTRLARSVAIKVLPADIAADPQRRARFEREATSLSQLTHPNICAVFDVGDDYLVMELLDGESLADRLTRGPLPIEQVLRIGIEVASALHYAHRSGIIHRDLKPANVMLTKSGAKLLDFGLAKAVANDASSGGGAATTAMRPLTEEGTIVGTVQYMSPEQLTGGLVDHRSDIFALGALLYEMITARRAFDGATRSSVITSILTRDPPPLTQSNAETPPPLQRVVATCLAKDADERWQSAHDVALELKALRDGVSSQIPQRSPPRTRALRAATVLLITIAALSAGYFLARRSSLPAAPVHLGIIPPPGSLIEDFILAPRGDMVAMLTHNELRSSVWIRDLSTDALHEVPDSEDVSAICFSPDGNSIAFIAKGRLFKAAASGGPAVMIRDGLGFAPGISWGPGDTLIFARDDDGGINRISATAGRGWTKITTVEVTPHRAARHMWPSFLPDGKHFLFLVDGESPYIAVGSVESNERPRRVLDDVASGAQYAPRCAGY